MLDYEKLASVNSFISYNRTCADVFKSFDFLGSSASWHAQRNQHKDVPG